MNDRYALYGVMASGGMAVVHYGRLRGPVGFSRIVAIKRLLPQMAADEDIAPMFIDEARLASRIRHPNVVPTLDVVDGGGELYLVMEYVHGETLSRLMSVLKKTSERVPPRVVIAIVCGILQGLHSAHEAHNEAGLPLRIVHRDVSPQNIIVGTDGIARLLDFGIAKAADRVATTREGQIKGKIRYMSPEQLLGTGVDRATDIYAASVVLWELMSNARMYGDVDNAAIIGKLMSDEVDPPRNVPSELDALVPIVMRGLAHDVSKRFATALDMALAIEAAVTPDSAARVGAWVELTAREALQKRSEQIARIESGEEEPQPSSLSSPRVDSSTAAPIARETRIETRRSWLGPVALGVLACAGTGALVWRLGRTPAATAAPALERAAPTASATSSAAEVVPDANVIVASPSASAPSIDATGTAPHAGLAMHHRHDNGIVRELPHDIASASVPTSIAPAASSESSDDLYRKRR